MTDKAISPLRRRLIEDMTIRRLSPKTHYQYIRHVKKFADFLGRSADKATAEDVHRYTSARQLHRIVRLAAGRAGITKRVGVHTLRHCFATHLLEQKTDIRIIQVLLGHKKLDTTALYPRVAVSTIGQVTSPLDFLRKMPG